MDEYSMESFCNWCDSVMIAQEGIIDRQMDEYKGYGDSSSNYKGYNNSDKIPIKLKDATACNNVDAVIKASKAQKKLIKISQDIISELNRRKENAQIGTIISVSLALLTGIGGLISHNINRKTNGYLHQYRVYKKSAKEVYLVHRSYKVVDK